MAKRVGQQGGRISRRAVVRELAGLAIVGVTGGCVVCLTRLQDVRISANVPQPTQFVTSSTTMFGVDTQHTRFYADEQSFSPATVSRLKSYWTASIGGTIESSPAVVTGVVYVGGSDGKLYAFEAATGHMLWAAMLGGSIRSSPAIAHGIVYLGCDDHKLYVFDAPTGSTYWAAATGGFVRSSPTITNDVFYVGSDDYTIYAFNAATGGSIWNATTGGIIESTPALANGVVFVGSGDGMLYAFDASTGQTLWA